MGYTGTIVVGHSSELLVHQDGIEGFGHRHLIVRPLGGGWQMVQTQGRVVPVELGAPVRRLAVTTGRAALAAHVFISSCGVLCTDAGTPTHLRPVDVIDDWEHQPAHSPALRARTAEDVLTELTVWSGSAGLTPDTELLRLALTADELVEDVVFALVLGLGVARIGRAVPRTIPVDEWPFTTLTSFAHDALTKSIRRGRKEPLRPWESAAIALDAEIWSLAYRRDADVLSLARRAAGVVSAGDRAQGWKINRPAVDGRLGPEDPDDNERAWVDPEVGRILAGIGSRDLTR